jgi:hypothetical protein
MNSSFAHLVSHPELLNRETLYELRTLLVRYPYSQSIRLLFLKNLFLLQDASFADELKKSVVYVNDRRTLFYLIEGDKYIPLSLKTHPLLHKLEEEPGVNRTFALIDAFLATMPPEEEAPEELLYVSDYTTYLENDTPVVEREETEPEDEEELRLRGQDLIDSFLTKAEAESILLKPLELQPAEEEEYEETSDASLASDNEDESYFTETLAKIYIRQHRYAKAIEIIKKLSLKYPKKNAYFADQIRFLEKLIINAKSK